MHQILTKIAGVAWHVCWTTSLQFAAVFGLILVAGAVLTFLSRLTSNTFRQFVFPKFGLYAFGLIGIPVHEFCHALFCTVFFHDVRKVKWFDPAGKGGAHGFVEHEYRPWNLYHRVGQFFIGVGPVLLGPVILAALSYLLVPTARGLFTPEAMTLATFGPRLQLLTHAFINKSALTTWTFWLFLYLTIAISSQMELSMADVKQAMTGSGFVLALLAVLNLILRLSHLNWHSRIVEFGLWTLSMSGILFAFAVLLSFINLLFCFFLMTFFNRCCGRNGINPFQM